MTTQKRSKIITVNWGDVREAVNELPSFLGEFCEDGRNLFLIFRFNESLSWKSGSCGLDFLKKTHELASTIEGLPVITIGVVEENLFDAAFEFLFLLDIAFAKPGLEFGFTVDFVPLFGGLQKVVSLFGLSMAKKVVFWEKVSSEELCTLGFMNNLSENPMKLVEEFVDAVSKRSPLALRLCKEILNASVGLPLATGLSLEREMFAYCFSTHDRIEGIKAFLEKREPEFKGR